MTPMTSRSVWFIDFTNKRVITNPAKSRLPRSPAALPCMRPFPLMCLVVAAAASSTAQDTSRPDSNCCWRGCGADWVRLPRLPQPQCRLRTLLHLRGGESSKKDALRSCSRHARVDARESRKRAKKKAARKKQRDLEAEWGRLRAETDRAMDGGRDGGGKGKKRQLPVLLGTVHLDAAKEGPNTRKIHKETSAASRARRASSILDGNSEERQTQVKYLRSAEGAHARQKEHPARGMALARRMMKKMGWSGDGHGLGKNETGMAEPVKAKMKRDTLGLGAVRESPIARQMRTFKEMEEEAFPSASMFPPSSGARPGRGWGVQDESLVGRIKGETVLLDVAAEEDTDEEEASASSSTPPPSSVPTAAPADGAGAFGRPGETFHRVRPDDPEVEEFKKQTGYDYVHRRFKSSENGNAVGDKGSRRLNPFQGREFKQRKQRLKNYSNLGTIDVNYRNQNRVVFKD